MKRVLCLLLASLLVLPLGARRLRVAFVGDPQVDNEKELSYARRSIYDELRGRSDLDMAIFLGDLVNDDVSLLAPIRAVLDSLPYAWASVPGNHDRDVYHVKGKARDMATYSRVIHATDTTFERGGVCFIMMDDVRLEGTGGYEGGFREDQKLWLRERLEALPADRLAVLCAHIPFNEFKAKDSLETIADVRPYSYYGPEQAGFPRWTGSGGSACGCSLRLMVARPARQARYTFGDAELRSSALLLCG